MSLPTFRTLCLAFSAFDLSRLTEVDPARLVAGNIGTPAQAEIGRPATAASSAGVARRTTRRTVARTHAYVNSSPRGCTTVIVDDAQIYLCGRTCYQPYGNQYVVVNVHWSPDSRGHIPRTPVNASGNPGWKSMSSESQDFHSAAENGSGVSGSGIVRALQSDRCPRSKSIPFRSWKSEQDETGELTQ